MNDAQKQKLLSVVRDAVFASVKGEALPRPFCEDPELNAHRGCFVTLKNQGRLRGCIGQFTSDKPLIQLAVEMGKASATGDSRFLSQPITPGELNQLEMEISVLSELKRTDDPLSLLLGRDGIYIKRGGFSGCFLPQVATETGWSKEQFLSECCAHKAGLSSEAWREPDTEVYLFSAEIFGGKLKDID